MRPPRLPPDLAGRFLLRSAAGALAIVREDFADAFDRAGLIGCAAPGPAPLRGSGAPGPGGGRGRTRIVPAGPLGEAVVRRYRRGGLVRRVSPDRYLRGRRAFDELVLTERLRLRDVPVAEPLAAVQAPRSPGYSACLVTRRLVGAEPAARVLARARPGECRPWMEEIGKAIRVLHEAGGWHADLNAWNVLLAPARAGVPPILVDFDRGRLLGRRVSGRRARGNLRRLRRSLRKLGLEDALAAWPALLRGYATDPGPRPAA